MFPSSNDWGRMALQEERPPCGLGPAVRVATSPAPTDIFAGEMTRPEAPGTNTSGSVIKRTVLGGKFLLFFKDS